MKQRSVELKTELDKTNDRIGELQTSLDAQKSSFDKVQKSYVAGKSDLEALQAEQSKLNALKQLVESLQSTAERLEGDYRKAVENESRAAVLGRLKTIANETESALNDYIAEREAAGKALKRAVDSFLAFKGKQGEFIAAFRELIPIETFAHIPKESREEFQAITHELESIALSKQTFDSAALVPNLPENEFGDLIKQAEFAAERKQYEAAAKERERQKQQRINKANSDRETALNAAHEAGKEKAVRQQVWAPSRMQRTN